MKKRIIICCDGTWNSPDEKDNGLPCPTNVSKIAHLISPNGNDAQNNDISQIIYYHDGVGTGNAVDKLAGGAFGVGLSNIIEECYRFLVNNYTEGDDLFFFGFSRGAYMARSLVGLIRNSGLLKKAFADKLPIAYQLYRDRSGETHPDSVLADAFKNQFSYEPEIYFLGVWDTVGSLGVPDYLVSAILGNMWNFHDISLSRIVKNAFQAVAIDEKRADFKPCVWDNQEGTNSQQVWFAGVHCDIGGGYSEAGLSDITLQWMVEKASSCGLNFELANLIINPDPSVAVHNSKTGFFELRPEYIRPVDPPIVHQSAELKKIMEIMLL
jgi:uncharacterized protein (DUF2235 family)